MSAITQEIEALSSSVDPQPELEKEQQEIIDVILEHEYLNFAWITRNLVERMIQLTEEMSAMAPEHADLPSLLVATAKKKSAKKTVDFFLEEIQSALAEIHEDELAHNCPSTVDKQLGFFGRNLRMFLKSGATMAQVRDYLQKRDDQRFKSSLNLVGKAYWGFYAKLEPNQRRRFKKVLESLLEYNGDRIN